MDIYEQLERDEGRKRFPYKDTEGILTIGVGHNLEAKGLTDPQIDQILHDDVAQVDGELHVLPWMLGLSDIRKGVLRNMGFQLGVSGLLQFHEALGHMERAEWEAAAAAMLQSKWAKQAPARANRLALQLRSGEWQ